MGRPRQYASDAERQAAYRARSKEDAASNAKTARRAKDHDKRVAAERATMMNHIRSWCALASEAGIAAAQKSARKSLHPDKGASGDDFIALTDLTNWMLRQTKQKALGFRVF
jgi:hypothetical protein